MWHAWERRDNYAGFWRENPKERDHSEDRRKRVNKIIMDPREIAWGR
jgi:hypothetical protein